MSQTLQQQFGQIDIYLFDQILRGNIREGSIILDAGCGHGRNLVYLLREGFEIYAVDADPGGVAYVRNLSDSLASGLPHENFQVGRIESMSFAGNFADVVICNSVLHFSQNDDHFAAMVSELWRVLKPGGILFCRLGSRIGMNFPRIQGNRYRIHDGSEWYLVDEKMLIDLTCRLNAVLADPLKTTIVQNHRCMTTWVVRKPSVG